MTNDAGSTTEAARTKQPPTVYGRGLGPYLYVLPAFLVFVPFVLFPFLRAIQLSMFEWDGLNDKKFVGLDNFTDALTDPLVRTSFRNAFELVAFIGVLPVCIGLVISAMSAQSRVPGDTALRTMIFLPQVIAGVVIGTAWRWIVAPEGPLNELLRTVGLGAFTKTWLGDSTWALPTIGMIGAWATVGLCVALFNAGIQQIPADLYEAAAVDGAGRVRSFFAVTLPGLRGPIAVALTLTSIGALRTFDLIFITTKGGPRHVDLRAGHVDLQPGLRHQCQRRVVGGDRDHAERGGVRRDVRGLAHRGAEGLMLISRADRISTFTVLAIAALITTLPILGIVLLSLHESNEQVSGFDLPDRAHFETYKTAWTTARFSTFMWNSAKISVIVVVATVVISVLSGYAFGTMRFRGANALFNVLLFGMIVPYEAVVVPLYHDLKWAHLTNTQWSVIMPLLGTNVAFGTYWMRAYFRTVPKSLIEAAAIDGAGSFRTLWKVLLPGGRPAVLTLTVLVFMWSWNEFLLPLIMLSSDDLRTAPLGLPYFSGRYSTDRVGLAAAAVMVALPIIIVFVALQRSFVRGMTAGAVKE